MPSLQTNEVLLDDVFERIGVGRFHVLLIALCGVGFAAAAVEIVLLGLILPKLRPLWELDEYQLGMLSAVKDGGVLLGELVWGSLADRYGRRSTAIASMAVVALFGAASAFSPGMNSMIALRFCVGFGYGGNLVVDLAWYSEFLPTRSRGPMLFALAFFWPIGQLLTTIIAWYVIPSYGWRWFVFICMAPSLLTICLLPLIPESPRWLCSQGRLEEATEICREIAIKNGLRPEDVGISADSQVTCTNETVRLQPSELADEGEGDVDWVKSWLLPFQSLFSPRYAKTSIGLMGVMMALNFAGYGATVFMPSLLEMKGISQNGLYKTMSLSALACFPGVIIAMVTSAKYGRVQSINFFVMFTMVSLLFFAFVRTHAALTALSCLASFSIEASYALFHVYMPEVYGTQVRATAGGFLEGFGTVIAIAAPFIVAFFLTNSAESTSAVFVLAAFTALGGVTSILHLHVETLDRDMDDGPAVRSALSTGASKQKA